MVSNKDLKQEGAKLSLTWCKHIIENVGKVYVHRGYTEEAVDKWLYIECIDPRRYISIKLSEDNKPTTQYFIVGEDVTFWCNSDYVERYEIVKSFAEKWLRENMNEQMGQNSE